MTVGVRQTTTDDTDSTDFSRCSISVLSVSSVVKSYGEELAAGAVFPSFAGAIG
jgi:hypothetical protein